jgi:16S rRNA G1207 methylase RsmC
VSHYFDPTSQPAGPKLTELEVCLAGETVSLVTAPGVFSAHRLDLGTAVLLRTEERWASPPEAVSSEPVTKLDPVTSSNPLPHPPVRQVLDLGCGWGALALVLARWYPQATVWAVDVNPRALDLTNRNAARLGLKNIKTTLPADFPAGLELDLIWSNPPIRVGKPQLHALLQQWLDRLAPHRHADLVVQKNLGADSLARWLQTTGPWSVEKLASAKGYRVLRVTSF